MNGLSISSLPAERHMHGLFFNEPIEQNFIGHIMSEIYRDNIYAPFVEGRKDLNIVDIGANIGITAYYFSQFAKTVYAMEPSIEHFDILAKNVKFNRLENVKIFRNALYTENKDLTLYHNKNKTMFSLHGSVADPEEGQEIVKATTMEQFFEDAKIKDVDLMKMDIEGTEPEIFAHESFRKVAKQIKTLVFEVHQWNQRNPNQIKDSLSSLGFKMSQMQSDANIWVASR